MFILAHLSDPHLAPLPRPRLKELVGKRVLGYLNWLRRRRAIHRREVLEDLVRDLRAQPHDHTVVTGDLVNIALEREFAPAREWLAMLGAPEEVTVIPGNHDIYVRAATNWPAMYWAAFMGELAAARAAASFPFARLRNDVALIALSSALPTGPFLATGRLGKAQLHALADLLRQHDGLFRIVLVHHPLETVHGRQKRLVDAAGLREVLRANGAELVLHGHDHVRTLQWLDGPRGRIPVVGVPSASAATGRGDDPAGYNLYRIERAGEGWRCEVILRSRDGEGKLSETGRQRLA